MNSIPLQVGLLKRDIEHEATQVVALAERIEGKRDANPDTVPLLNSVVDGLKAVRSELLTHLMSSSTAAPGASGIGLDDDEDAPF